MENIPDLSRFIIEKSSITEPGYQYMLHNYGLDLTRLPHEEAILLDNFVNYGASAAMMNFIAQRMENNQKVLDNVQP